MSSNSGASWMTQDPQKVPCPQFGWYVPRYLSPGYSAISFHADDHSDRTMDEYKQQSVAHHSSPLSCVDDHTNSSPLASAGCCPPPMRYRQGGPSSSHDTFLSTSGLMNIEAFFPSIMHSLLSPRDSFSTMTEGARTDPATKRSRVERETSERNSGHASGDMGTHSRYGVADEDKERDVDDTIVVQMESLVSDEIKRRSTVGVDWNVVTPLEHLWNGPALSSAVPPASDYARLLDKLNI